ncbi:hypothetical protein GQ457_09G010620 [Hibiscus cannabinus]
MFSLFSLKVFWKIGKEENKAKASQGWLWKRLLKIRDLFLVQVFSGAVSEPIAKIWLPTKDRLLAHGIALDETCVMCGGGIETYNHLFFECASTKLVWKEILLLCGISREVFSWEQELDLAVMLLEVSRDVLSIVQDIKVVVQARLHGEVCLYSLRYSCFFFLCVSLLDVCFVSLWSLLLLG